MKKKNQPCGTQTQSTPKTTLQSGDLVCLGIDQHADSLVVVEQINACVPRPARKFPAQSQAFYRWVEERQKAGARVVACYAAGPCGNWLQRVLSARSVECLVVAPKWWAENGKTKTDSRDARVLCERLFQWVGGKTNVFTLVRVPSEEEERFRNLSRNRERLLKERKRLAQAGRGIALGQQMRLKGQWWKGKRWTELANCLEELLGPIREVLLSLETQIDKLTTKLESHAAAREARPAGLGKLTDAVLSAEVGDYRRFDNRRGPGAYFGLVPGEDSSGKRKRSLPI
jgi:transposase